MHKKIFAPVLDKKLFKQLSPEQFNRWRVANDHPRIVAYFKKNLEHYDDWAFAANLCDEDLVQHGPAAFMGPKGFHTFSFPDDTNKIDGLHFNRLYNDNTLQLKRSIQKNGETKTLRYVPSYLEWVRNVYPSGNHTLFQSSSDGPEGACLGPLQLLDLRGVFQNATLDGRYNLDFCDLRGCSFFCGRSIHCRIWYSSLAGVHFSGNIAFVDLHNTSLGDKLCKDYVRFAEGDFQSWTISQSYFYAHMNLCNLSRWILIDTPFHGTFKDVVLYEVDAFSSKNSNGLGPVTYRNLKKLYSEAFDYDSAAKMHVKEKRAVRRTYANPFTNYNQEFGGYAKPTLLLQKRPTDQRTLQQLLTRLNHFYSFCRFLLHFRVCKSYTKYYTIYIFSLLQDVIWGYGERTYGIFLLAFFTVIIAFPTLFYFWGPTETTHSFINSLYFSMVTFSTLGYGDIAPQSDLVKLLCGLEGLLGIVFMTLVITSFINKASK